MESATPSHRYYPALDGLRGVAILLVVFLHNFRFMNYFFFGWLGVDLFFVLSGFLITDILMNTVGQPGFLKNFYLRRILRIFPLFYLSLVIFLVILPRFSHAPDVHYYTEHQGWFWAYLQNWLFVFRPPQGDPVLLHTWSLAVEEQFYLVWPFIILLWRKPKRLLWFALAVLVVTGVARYVVWTLQVEDLAYSSLYTFTRIDGLCIGAMVALLMRMDRDLLKKNSTWLVLGMAAINFIFYFLNIRRGFTLPYLAFVGYTTFAFLFGLLVYEAVRGESRWIRLALDNRPLKFFGRISYGFYVWHWPVYLLFFEPVKTTLLRFSFLSFRQAELISAIAVTLFAIGVSLLSYYFYEKPFLRWKKRFS